ncbi:unnamed protein product [Adineta ricciae]|uniref:N-acetyltransferase domain-containing protein n=1 Tax=Adineta ricciae TaxID=249248 RepID=A0A814ALW9_ADIRI|nr:unnamed protein product [Adineta ricciae]CAF1174195.1 unnamed protein product [Adineta ricciae]
MTTNPFVVRRATSSDSDAIAQLSRQTWRETYLEDLALPIPDHDVESYLRTEKSSQWYANKIADPQEATWVMEDTTTGEIVAFLIVGRCEVPHPEFSRNRDGQIEYLYVRRDRQSQGFGKQLMNIALSWLEEQFPERPVWLTTLACNLKSQKMYMNYGFTTVGEFISKVGNTERHFIVMRRESRSAIQNLC